MKFLRPFHMHFLSLVGVGIVVYVILQFMPATLPRGLTAAFFDVGQGDGQLIVTPGDQVILIDGGPDESIIDSLDEYLLPYQDTIDLMILTHPHADHLAGLNRVFERYKVERVLATGVIHTTDTYLEWLDMIREEEALFDVAVAGMEYVFESLNGPVTFSVLYPHDDISGEQFDDQNETSVVFMMAYGDARFLFTGDMTEEVEYRLLDEEVDVWADVLKVAHHGSITSSSQVFLDEVQPQYAVISVGENDYGHPSLRVLRRLERVGAWIYRTDRDGDIVFRVDMGGDIEVHIQR